MALAACSPSSASGPTRSPASSVASPAAGTASGPGADGSTGVSEPLAELKQRPRYERAAAEYLAMLDEMRLALTQITPSLHWSTPKSTTPGPSGCYPPFDEIEGAASGTFESGTGSGSIPDADWPRAVETLKAIAAKHRFTPVQTVVNTPGRHIVALKDSWGGSLELGTQTDTTLGLISGCFIQEHPVVYRPDPSTPSTT